MMYICNGCVQPCTINATGADVTPTVCPFEWDECTKTVLWKEYKKPKKAAERREE